MEVATVWWRPRPGLRDKALNLRQLAVMMEAHVPLPRALEVLATRGAHPELAEAWRYVLQSVISGKSLARSWTARPRVFGMLEVGMVRVAERSCCLVAALRHLAEVLEREYQLVHMVGQALHYPLFLLVTALIGMVLFMTHLLPVFMGGLAQDMDLPLLTRILLWIAETLRQPLFVGFALGSVTIGGTLFYRYVKTPPGLYQWQHLLLNIYGIGAVIKQMLLARFCRTLALLVRSGMSLPLSLEVASDALAHYPFSEAVLTVSADVKDGYSLGEAFGFSSFFPRLFSRMVAIGEESGDVASVFEHLAQNYEQQVSLLLSQLSQLLEPLMLLMIGTFMGISLVGMFLPLYQCIGAIQ